MSRLRVLLLAPDANPQSICGPLIGYSQAQALAQLHDVTLVIRSPLEEAVRGKQAEIHSLHVVRLPRVERIYAWIFRRIFKGDHQAHAHLQEVLQYPFSIAFEWQAWRHLRARILAGEFDVAIRLLPVVTVQPSPFAYFLRKGPIPFVIGPLNGGLPWPEGFTQAQRQKQWISGLRGLYRYMPFARSTHRHAAAIIAGSSHTYAELAAHREKLFFLPENGLAQPMCEGSAHASRHNDKLELIFVGALVPRKACDLALRAAAPLLRSGLAHFTVVGDGPERNRLEQLTRSVGIEKAVSFRGQLSHSEVLEGLRFSDVLVFPSVREFGGGVVFEALASGAVPVVVDFGGPGDIVRHDVGFKVPLTNEDDVVAQMEKILAELEQDRELLDRLRQQGMAYARDCLTWDAKARTLTAIMRWALRQGPKPDLPPPGALQPERVGRPGICKPREGGPCDGTPMEAS